MTTRWLVVNADDAGLAPSTDHAILRCLSEGVVSAASVAANGATAASFVERAAELGAHLGLHVNLTQGRALAGPHRTLTDAEGRFPGDKEVVWRRGEAGELDAAELRAEVEAQWERLRDIGVEPTHVDGHNHVHLIPVVRALLSELAPACRYRIPVQEGALHPSLPRVLLEWSEGLPPPARATDAFAGYRFCDEPAAEVFLGELIERDGAIEFMVHPGARSGSTFASSHLRDRETEVLCDPALRDAIEARGFRLAGFGDLPCA